MLVENAISLLPQDENSALALIRSGMAKITEGQIQVRLPVAKLAGFLEVVPVGSSFMIQETGELLEVVSEQTFWEERIIHLMSAINEAEHLEVPIDMDLIVNARLRDLELLKGTYGLTLTEKGCWAKIDECEVEISWDSRLPKISDKRGRCYGEREAYYRHYIETFDLQPLFAALEDALREGEVRPLSTRAPLSEQEEAIALTKIRERLGTLLAKNRKRVIEQYKNSLFSELNKAFLGLAHLFSTVEDEEIQREWEWFTALYVPLQRLELDKESLTIRGPRRKWTFTVGSGLSLTLRSEPIGTLTTIPLMMAMGAQIASEVCKLYGQGRIPALSLLVLDSLHLL